MRHLTPAQTARLQFGEELRFVEWPELACTFKFKSHDGLLVVSLSQSTHAAWGGPLDRIVRQSKLALPEATR